MILAIKLQKSAVLLLLLTILLSKPSILHNNLVVLGLSTIVVLSVRQILLSVRHVEVGRGPHLVALARCALLVLLHLFALGLRLEGWRLFGLVL